MYTCNRQSLAFTAASNGIKLPVFAIIRVDEDVEEDVDEVFWLNKYLTLRYSNVGAARGQKNWYGEN